MGPLPLFLNILWVLFGGLWMAIAWLVAGALMVVTIIGIPWTRAAGVLGNIIWLVLAGWWLALGHLAIAILQAATIIGLPFAWAHLKLAGFALWPIGRVIVPINPPGYAR